MKIKKVEIEAFRAYDKIEDSTFDFTLKGDSIADFISIYAPNGYGKTSFYDAVEWGVTGQISRFHRNASEYRKSGIDNRKNNKDQYFLQHNGRQKLGSVKVHTDATVSAFNKKRIARTKVYDFNKEGENLYFKYVMLSQDLIDSFIKEDKAEDRYKSFIKSIPSLNKYNIGLQNIIKLLESLDKKIAILEEKIEQYEKKKTDVDFDGDNKILEQINISISILMNNDEDISLVDKQKFSENELSVLTQNITSRVTQLKLDIEKLRLYIEYIDASFNGSSLEGDKKKIGVVKYIDFVDKRAILKRDSDLLKQKLDIEQIITRLTKRLDILLDKNDKYFNVKKQFNSYLTIRDNLVRLDKDKDDIDKKLNSVRFANVVDIKEESVLSHDISKLNENLSSILEKKERLPKELVKLRSIEDRKIILINELQNLEKCIQKNSDDLNIINESIRVNKFYTEKIKENSIEHLFSYSLLSDYKDKLNKILELNKINIELQSKLEIIDAEIIIHESLNQELKGFISKGLEIIKRNEYSECPFCSASYDSYQILSERISNNSLLGDILKKKLGEKLVIENKIKIKKDLFQELVKEINDVVLEQEILKNKEKKDINILLDKNKNSAKNLLSDIKICNDKIKMIIQFLDEQTPQEFEEQIQSNVKKLNEAINSLTQLRKTKKLKISEQKDIISKLLKNNELIDEAIKQEKQSIPYNNIILFFKDTLKTNVIDLVSLERVISDRKTEELEINKKLISNKMELNIINNKLGPNNYLKNELVEEINKLQDKLLSINTEIKNFELFIYNEFNITLENKLDVIIASFESFKNIHKEKLERLQYILDKYIIVDSLKDNSYKFLEYERTKADIYNLNKEKTSYIKVRKMLKSEKDDIEQFLKNSVNNFFYTDLINSIYSKMDPHPEYVNIEFDCDFNDRAPRLQIYTVDLEGKKSIPSLYFSSAQINILSLSVFLARALKTVNPTTKEDIKCIFIDDPIQSMDSINVLSFIDLFRGISINLDRQLIISTHEENFHLLLQKKIPKTLFNSKYFQFETFGKLMRTKKI